MCRGALSRFWHPVGVTLEATRSGIDLSHVDAEARPQDDLFGHVNGRWLAEYDDPRGPGHRRRVPHAVRPRRGAGARPDHRGRAGGRRARHGHRRSSASATSTPASWTSDAVERARRAAAARRAGRHRRRGRPGRAGRGARRAAAHRRGRRRRASTSTPTPRTPPATCCTSPSRASGLPDESYYRDEQHADDPGRLPAPHRRDVRAGVRRGARRTTWQSTAARIVALETKLAAAHWDVVKRRDADLTYNLRTFADLPTEAPGFDWTGWITALGDHTGGGGRTRGAPARLPDRVRRAVGRRGPRGLEALAALAADPRPRRSCSPTTWSPRTSTSTAARCRGTEQIRDRWKRGGVAGGEPDGRRCRQALRRAALPAGRQGPHGRAGRQPARGLPGQHQRPGLDDAGDPAARAGQAGQVHRQDRLPDEVARLLGAGDRPRRPVRQLPARLRGRLTTASWPSWAARSTATSGS